MSIAANPAIMRAVEKLGYRVTIGDVASQAGLDVKLAERDLLALASEAGGHMQVAESGEIAYSFPRNFRDILRNKYWRLRWQERLGKVWNLIFYLIRISFGIYLIVSIALIGIAIVIILVALSSSRDGDSGDSGDFMPTGGFGGDWFIIFTPDYYSQRSYRRRQMASKRGRGRGYESDESSRFCLGMAIPMLIWKNVGGKRLEPSSATTVAQSWRNKLRLIWMIWVAPLSRNMRTLCCQC
jgi:hypothetical protein